MWERTVGSHGRRVNHGCISPVKRMGRSLSKTGTTANKIIATNQQVNISQAAALSFLRRRVLYTLNMTRIVQHLWEAIRFERRLLQRLQEAVLRDEVLDYTVERLREELQRRHEALSCQLLALREERRRIQCKIANLVEAIASRKGSPNLMAAIADREEKIREITDRLIEPGPDSFQQKLDDLRTFALQRLSNIRSLLGKTDAIREARALLAEQFGKFTLNRVKDAWSYKAEGSVNFFGESLIGVGGAGGQNRTGYARLFRAALYH